MGPGRPKKSATADQEPDGPKHVYCCLKCDVELGRGDNRWERLSRSYASLVQPDSILISQVNVGQDLQRAAAATDLEGW